MNLVPTNELRPYRDFSLKKWEAPCYFQRTGDELCSHPGETILFLSTSMAIVEMKIGNTFGLLFWEI